MSSEFDLSVYVEPNVLHTTIPDSILEDLCSRFLINLPEDEQDDMVRVFFQIEQAHWYYVDFYCQEEQALLPSCALKQFTRIIFEKFPFLNKKGEKIDKLMSDWKKYKFSVPVYGAILLDSNLDKCVLVEAYTSKSSWGFPRGKLNKDESPLECAIREVLEETGFDITSFVNKDIFLENSIHDRLVRLYLVPNVPVDTEFETRTRGEIKDIQWFFVKDLPAHRKDTRPKENIGLNPSNFFMVLPFVKALKKWISNQQRERSVLKVEHQGVQSRPENQLQRLVQAEEDHLHMENERFQDDRRREVAQQRFLNQLDFYHPLKSSGYGNAQPKAGNRGSSEPDQKQFRILQRPGADERDRRSPQSISSPQDRRSSPQGRRQSPRGQQSSPQGGNSPSPLVAQESINLTESRSLSPSCNSAFTRVSRGTRVSPKVSRRNKSGGSRAKVGSPSESTRQPKATNEAGGPKLPACGFNFLAPAWMNFTFNKEQILAAVLQ